MSKSVLIIAYFFPPTGGAGVQRTTKFVKYLPASSWMPTVLTVANPSVPVFDTTFAAEIPDSVAIVKAKTLEPDYKIKNAVSASAGNAGGGSGLKTVLKKALRNLSNFILQPDPQILWLPAAYRTGKKLIAEKKFDVIFVTAPPFSSLLIGALLSKRSGIPLVVDFRDEWDISNAVWENKLSGKFSAWIQSRMQRFVLGCANAVIATTEMSAAALSKKLADLGRPVKAACIFNGYDPADFMHVAETGSSNDKFQLAYVGTLWNLTSIAPVITALLQLHQQMPELCARIRLVIAGRITADQKQLLNKLQATSVELVVHDYLDHPQALALMRNSNALCLLLGAYDFAGRVVPAKTFEYLATGNLILAIAPKGEVWNILSEFDHALCISPTDIDTLATAIARQVTQFSAGAKSGNQPDGIEKYSRPVLTAMLAGVLDDVADSRKRQVP